MQKIWNPKVGDILYTAYADVEDDGKCSVCIYEWVVRTILNRTTGQHTFAGIPVRVATLIQKNEFTWVKKKGKSQDFDWAKPVDPFWRKSYPTGNDFPHGYYTTKRQALVAEMTRVKASMKPGGWKDSLPEEEKKAIAENDKRLLSLVQSRITRIANVAGTKRLQSATA